MKKAIILIALFTISLCAFSQNETKKTEQKGKEIQNVEKKGATQIESKALEGKVPNTTSEVGTSTNPNTGSQVGKAENNSEGTSNVQKATNENSPNSEVVKASNNSENAAAVKANNQTSNQAVQGTNEAKGNAVKVEKPKEAVAKTKKK